MRYFLCWLTGNDNGRAMLLAENNRLRQTISAQQRQIDELHHELEAMAREDGTIKTAWGSVPTWAGEAI